jgi:hypothetical protein
MKNIEGALKLLSEYIGEFGGGCGDNSLGIGAKFRVAYAQQELASLKQHLKEIEWGTERMCPACWESERNGHKFDCWLHLVIKD